MVMTRRRSFILLYDRRIKIDMPAGNCPRRSTKIFAIHQRLLMQIIFERYVIAITSLICFVYSPMIGFFAYRTQQFNHSSLQPDFALTILSIVMLISSISNIICAYQSRLRGLLLLIYVNIMLVVFQLVFVIAMIIFSNDLKQYVNKYFGNQTTQENQIFLFKIQKDVFSLCVFNIIVICMEIIQVIAAIRWIGYQRFLRTVIPCFCLIQIIYSLFLFITGATIHGILLNANQKNNTISISMIVLGILMSVMGILGYLAYFHQKLKLVVSFLMGVTLTNMAFLMLGMVSLFYNDWIIQFVKENQYVFRKLMSEFEQNQYVDWAFMNLKFAGLLYLSFFLLCLPLTYGSFVQIKTQFDLMIDQK